MDVIHHQTQFTISSTNSNFSTLNCNSLNSSSNSTSNITSNIKNIDNKNDQQQQQHQQQQQQTIQQQNSLSTCSSTTYDNINDEHYFNPTIYETFNQQNHLINTENNFNHIVTPLSSTSIGMFTVIDVSRENATGAAALRNVLFEKNSTYFSLTIFGFGRKSCFGPRHFFCIHPCLL